MTYSNELFSEQLNQVKDQFQNLSTTLEEVCENLKGPGSPPSSEILKKITNAIESFEELKSYVTKWAQDVQMPDTEAQELDSLKAITTFSQDIVNLQNQVQDEKVLGDINRARSIQYTKEGEPFPPLDNFLRKLDKLENRVSTSPISDEGLNDRTQIFENKHPINYVLKLLEPEYELDLENHGQDLEIISREYGPTFMGVVAAPGSLILPDLKGPQPPPDVEEASKELEPESADDLPVGGQAEVQQEEIPAESPAVKIQEESDKSEPESADDLQVDRQVEVQKEKTKSEDAPDKDVVTDLKQEIDSDLPDKEVPVKLDFNASETAQSIASSLLQSFESKFERGFPDLFWALIQENRLSLAYWLARYVENKELDLSFTPPSYLVEALIHGLAIQNETDSSAHFLYDIYNNYNKKFESLESKESGYDAGIRLLVMAGALRPSLFAPHTGAHTVLKSHAPLSGLDAFFAIGQAVEKFAEQGLPIIIDSLTDAKDDQQWQEELDSLIEDATEWLERAPKMRMKYRPLERIWQGFVTDGKWIHNFVSPVVKNDESKIKDVLGMIQQCGTKRRIKDQVENQVDRVVTHKLKCGLAPLERGVQEAVVFASRWVKLCEQKPKQGQDYRTGLIRTLRDDIQRHIGTARDELNVFAKRHKDYKPILAGVAISHHVLNAITGLLNGETLSTESDERILLSAELLKIPNLELTEEWVPTEETLDILGDHLLQHIALADPDPTWVKAFEKQTKHRNHWATKHILNRMATAVDDDEIISKLEEARQEAIGQCITALENDIDATKKKIGNSVRNGTMTVEEQAEFVQQVEEIASKQVLNFGLERRKLKMIRNQIVEINNKCIDECKNQLEKLNISNDDKKKIDAVLKRGDVGTAEEFIASLENGEQLLDLDEDNGVDQLLSFFEAIRELEDKQLEKIISCVKNGGPIGYLNIDRVPEDQRPEVADVLTNWSKIKKNSGDNFPEDFIEGLRKILGWLGFEAENKNISQPEPIASRVWVSLKATVPIRCPIPVFGSESEGLYRVMCVWTWPGEDEILDWIDQKAKGQATIVFYFGRMTVQMRRDLARSKRSSFPSFLLVDEYQLLFLCAERGSRLPPLFDCAMPFARINPYTPFVPGNVPPEMFVGRGPEAKDLMDLNGTCFIYGGRQLGKTALLRYVEREFENDDYKAIYLDLKTKPTGLWPALGKSLRDKGIILRRQKSNSSTILVDRIKQWLDAPGQSGRRVLLLLDESDDFLEKDAKEKFRDVGELKGLMENTGRRFKVIFAGLHNVQRFSAIPNQPIAHLGKPLSIGPLTSRAAQDLIVKPLRTLGYRFKDPSLVTTILFEMNRYPNLIQLFCNELLKHLKKIPFPAKEIPPYTIFQKHIDEVYHSQDLQSHIRDRFRWTLDLDKRYRFIAYKFAYEIRAGAGDEGFTANWIADEARREWAKGFAETSHNDEIRGLLDEMTGLSILVKTQNNRYRLRSPNVLKLLGDDEEIAEELIEITQYAPSPEFDPNSFRRPIDEISQEDRIRSPFTIAQEADILKSENDIRLIFGSKKLGIERVSEGVKAAVEDVENYVGQVHFLDPDIKSSKRLLSWLQKLIDKTEEGHVVPIIPLERAGSESENLIEWVETSLDVINRRRSERRPIRILFLIPPEVAQIWVRIPKEKREELTDEGGRELKLKRWNDTGLQHWLDGLIPPNIDEQRKDILNATGGWPIFIMENFAKRCIDDEMPWKEVIKEIRETRQKPDDDLKKGFGLIQMDRVDQVWQKLYDWCIKDSQKGPEPIDFGTLREFINEDGMEDMSPEGLRQIIDYLDYMNLIEFENIDQICPELVAAKMTLEE